METVDNDPGTSQSADNKPALMFKIASKRKRWRSQFENTPTDSDASSC